MHIEDSRIANTTCVLWAMRHTSNPIVIIPNQRNEDLIDEIFQLYPNVLAAVSPGIVCMNPLYKDKFIMPEMAFDVSLSMEVRAIMIYETFTQLTE